VTPSAVLLTRPLGHKPLAAAWPVPQQSVLSPAKKIRPDRCGAATLTPQAAPTYQADVRLLRQAYEVAQRDRVQSGGS
jgi:hypothetical protein